MVYAPVLIPTLNRIEHFTRCVESLKKNLWAKYTDVFISVDYSKDEKYIPGRERIIKYLKEGDFSVFKSFNVIYQKENLGPTGSFEFLRDLIENKGYDRYIIIEDDNEVSPNFLEYMDKGLEYSLHDKKIIAVCACVRNNRYNDSTIIKNLKSRNKRVNAIIDCSYNPYGAGFLLERHKQMKAYLTTESIDFFSSQIKNVLKLRRIHEYTFFLLGYVYHFMKLPVCFRRNGEVAAIDFLVEVYMQIKDMYCIFPTENKVRNWGEDGSGVNCGSYESDPTKVYKDENEHYDENHYLKITKREHIKLQRKASIREVLIGWYCFAYYYIKPKFIKNLLKKGHQPPN